MIISVANLKGGVGKTACTHNLGAVLSRKYKVLLIDLDQGSLSGACGIDSGGIAEVIGGKDPGIRKMEEIIQEVQPGLFIAPSGARLAHSISGLSERLGRENILLKALAGLDYDYILIDNPPSLSLLSINSLTASQAVIIPVQPQQSDLRGLKSFLDTIDQVRKELNPDLDYKILITFFDKRLNHHKAAVKAMESLPLFKTRIMRSIRIAEATGAARPVVDYVPGHKSSKQFIGLSEEVIKWQKI